MWLVNFADVLEGAGNIGVAARVRRQAWDEARRRRLADPDVFTNRAALHAYARMVTQYEPGDASLAVIRQVLAGTRDNGGRVEVAAKELVLAWGLSTEQFDASRAWLWSQYGRNLARPVWARAQLAISETDRETLESLLAMDERSVPSLNRMEVAGALEHIPMVQTLAFEALERQPADEGAHERLVEDLPKSAPHLALQTELFERGILRGAKAVATAQLWLTPLVGVAPYLVEQTQKSTDQESLVGVPANDRRAGAKTRIRHQYGDTELDIGHRHALGSFAYLSIQHTKPATTGLQTTVGVALNAETLESVPLAVGGKKNEIDIILNYSFSRREYVRARPWAADYSAQTGGSLGSASGIEWEAGYRVRLDYPDLAVRLSGTHFRARPVDLANPSSAVLNPGGSAPAGSFFLPPNFNFYSLSVGFGEQYEQQYTRGLRVFGSAGPTWSDIAGTGFNFLLGAGRAILGSDYLSIFARRSEGGLGRSSRLKSFGLHYKYHF